MPIEYQFYLIKPGTEKGILDQVKLSMSKF